MLLCGLVSSFESERFIKDTKTGTNWFITVKYLQFPVSCRDPCWSLFPFCPVWTQSTWTVLALAEPSNRGLLIADGISIHVCRRILDIRQSCWVARAPHCPSTPSLRYVVLTGQGPCRAFSGCLQRCQTPGGEVKRSRRGWFGSLKGWFWSGVGGKSTKSAAWHSGRGYHRFLTLHRSDHPALLGQHQQQPVWPVSNSCPAAARAQLSARM